MDSDLAEVCAALAEAFVSVAELTELRDELMWRSRVEHAIPANQIAETAGVSVNRVRAIVRRFEARSYGSSLAAAVLEEASEIDR